MHWFLKFIFETKFYMFRAVPLSIIRIFLLYTQQWYMSDTKGPLSQGLGASGLRRPRTHMQINQSMVYVIQVCWQLAARKLSAKLYDIYSCCVYSEKLLMNDRGTARNT